MKLRPHHGMCIAHFKGLGYNKEFIDNMQKVIDKLKLGEELITLVCHTDEICNSCPHNLNEECQSGQKVFNYDNSCLELCGIKENQKITWIEFSAKIMQNIILAGKLSEVCKECQWMDTCQKITTENL